MDDHGQPEFRSWASGDCNAAECLESDPVSQNAETVEMTQVEVTARGELRPFVWQSGRRLFLLEREQEFWVLAELEFIPGICRYSELRRAFYRWEREALGAFLSRVIRFGDEAAAESADLLDVWIRRRRR